MSNMTQVDMDPYCGFFSSLPRAITARSPLAIGTTYFMNEKATYIYVYNICIIYCINVYMHMSICKTNYMFSIDPDFELIPNNFFPIVDKIAHPSYIIYIIYPLAYTLEALLIVVG